MGWRAAAEEGLEEGRRKRDVAFPLLDAPAITRKKMTWLGHVGTGDMELQNTGALFLLGEGGIDGATAVANKPKKASVKALSELKVP